MLTTRPRRSSPRKPSISFNVLRALLLAATADTALAQERETQLPTTTRDGLVIEEVIVTVSKREESLQDVLGSVSAFSGNMLKQNNVQDFNSLVELVPGMVAQDEDKIAIRGISRTREGPSPVAFHVNDVFIAMRGEPFYDLEAVEILRGPSGTLFGRNATAGAINAKWQRPETRWSAGGSVRYSDLGERQLRAFINIPFLGEDDPRLLGRIAAQAREGDGTIDNLLAADDHDPAAVSDYFVRLYLSSEPTDNLRLALRAIRYESTPKGVNLVFSPSLETRRSGTLEELGAQPLPDDVTQVRSNTDQRFGEGFSKFTRVDGDVTWSLQDLPLVGDIDLVVVGGVLQRDAKDVFDLDGTEEPITEGRTLFDDDHRHTAEIRLLSQNDSGFDWLLGAFWYRQTVTENVNVLARNFVNSTTLGFPALPGNPEVIVDVEVQTVDKRILDQSEALFLNLNFDLARLLDGPPIELTAGIRQNRDTFSNKTARNTILITAPGLGAQFPFIEQTDIRQFADFTETTGELGGRWFYSDTGMAYLEFSRGYKPGLAQLVESASEPARQNPVDAEFLNAIEIGWKAEFFQRSLILNLAAFHYDYRDLQVTQITPGSVITENAASATIRGVEVETQWTPTANLRVQASAAWTDGRYDEYCGSDEAREDSDPEPGCTEDNPMNFDGDRLPAAPEYSAALLASYFWSLGDWGSLTPSLKVSWTDEIDRRGLGNPNDIVESHSTSDLRLAWDSPGEHWRVEAFVENIEDNSDIFFQAFAPIGGRPNTFTLINNIPPRLYGVSVEARF